MTTNTDKIRQALTGKKAAVMRPALVEKSGLSGKEVSSALITLMKRGAVLKHKGPTPRTTGYSLNPEFDPVKSKVPRPVRSIGARASNGAKKRKYTKRAAPLQVAAGFRCGITSDKSLLVVHPVRGGASNGDTAEFREYNREQTLAIADLVLAHFEAD
jgi:hypothetical protein